MRQAKGPEFIRFFKPILEVMRKLGGSGRAAEIVDGALELAKVTEAGKGRAGKNRQGGRSSGDSVNKRDKCDGYGQRTKTGYRVPLQALPPPPNPSNLKRN